MPLPSSASPADAASRNFSKRMFLSSDSGFVGLDVRPFPLGWRIIERGLVFVKVWFHYDARGHIPSRSPRLARCNSHVATGLGLKPWPAPAPPDARLAGAGARAP